MMKAVEEIITDFLNENDLDGLTDGDGCYCYTDEIFGCLDLGEFQRAHLCQPCVIHKDKKLIVPKWNKRPNKND